MKSRRGTKARRLRKAAIFSSKAPHKDAVLLIEEKVDITHLIEDGIDLRRYYNGKRH
jgi:hypothetical protein